MSGLLEELGTGLTDLDHFGRILLRLTVALLLGALIGLERQRQHRPAGWRTHMLVSLGSALFTLVASPTLGVGMDVPSLSRVIQGVAAGIGFLGAGTILKRDDEHRVEGLTSAASVWVTAALGVAAGSGWLGPALLAGFLAWAILYVCHKIEIRLHFKEQERREQQGLPQKPRPPEVPGAPPAASPAPTPGSGPPLSPGTAPGPPAG